LVNTAPSDLEDAPRSVNASSLIVSTLINPSRPFRISCAMLLGLRRRFFSAREPLSPLLTPPCGPAAGGVTGAILVARNVSRFIVHSAPIALTPPASSKDLRLMMLVSGGGGTAVLFVGRVDGVPTIMRRMGEGRPRSPLVLLGRAPTADVGREAGRDSTVASFTCVTSCGISFSGVLSGASGVARGVRVSSMAVLALLPVRFLASSSPTALGVLSGLAPRGLAAPLRPCMVVAPSNSIPISSGLTPPSSSSRSAAVTKSSVVSPGV